MKKFFLLVLAFIFSICGYAVQTDNGTRESHHRIHFIADIGMCGHCYGIQRICLLEFGGAVGYVRSYTEYLPILLHPRYVASIIAYRHVASEKDVPL